MKKEWIFFCVIFTINLCPAISLAHLIAWYIFYSVNNTITVQVRWDTKLHTIAECSLPSIIYKQKTEILSLVAVCFCGIDRYIKIGQTGFVFIEAGKHLKTS